MTDLRWQGYPAMTDPLAGTDEVLVNDVSDHTADAAGTNKRASVGQVLSGLRASFVTVSPFGTGSGAAHPNAGADYGPDTPSTVTSGIQEAVNYAITQAKATGHAAPDVVLLPGKFTLSAFTNTTYRSVITVDAGYAVQAGPPVSITIRGVRPATAPLNGTAAGPSYPVGGTVLDCSALDVLQFGLYKQGRVFFVPPYAGTIATPCSATQLNVENMTIVLPAYSPHGTGATYTIGSGYGSMGLFVAGNSASTNDSQFLFVNGIDAWGATSETVRGVLCISALAALNPNGDGNAGGGGVFPLGSACSFVFPANSNEGNVIADRISSFGVPIGEMNSCHLVCNSFYVQYPRAAIYNKEGGHGSLIQRINFQEGFNVVQHAQLPQLTNSVGGPGLWDPIGDEYAFYGASFPASAAPSSMIITEGSIESIGGSFLVDDPANPLTLIADVEHTGTQAVSGWGAGANLMVNMIDVQANAQTVLAGTTAGSATWTQSGKTPWDKRTVVYLAGYENTTGVAQTITFTIAYNHVPAIIKDDSGGVTVTATTLTLPASMSTTKTGYIILEGY